RFLLNNDKIRPFFIVSACRGGTTLLRKEMLKNRCVYIPPESEHFIPHNALMFLKSQHLTWDEITRNIIANFTGQPFFRFWSPDLTGLQVKLDHLPEEKRTYADIIHTLYEHVSMACKPEFRVWGDKTP